MDWASFVGWITTDLTLSAVLYGLAALVVVVGVIVFLFVRKKSKVVVQNVSKPTVRVMEGVEISCPQCGERLVWTQNEKGEVKK